jgi:hypothetical protein
VECKTQTTLPGIGVSYRGVASPDPQLKPPRRVGRQECARGSISDFATLVRKSYSGSLSPVGTLVLLERIFYSASELGNDGNSYDRLLQSKFNEAARG